MMAYALLGTCWGLLAGLLGGRALGPPMLYGVLASPLIGLAVGLTTTPVAWLLVFGRHRRIAYQGDWTRAARRGGWVGLIVAIFIVLRLQGALELPIALFILALASVAEATLSAER